MFGALTRALLFIEPVVRERDAPPSDCMVTPGVGSGMQTSPVLIVILMLGAALAALAVAWVVGAE